MIAVTVKKEKGSGSVPGYRTLPRTMQRIFRFVRASRAGVLSVVFVSPSIIQQLNRRYRRKNRSTDILSFQYSEQPSFFFGELIIAPAVIRTNARARGVSFDAELLHALMHGFLHCLGLHHEQSQKVQQRMESIEQRFLEKHVPREADAFHPSHPS